MISSAIDKAVNEINLQPLNGKEVYLDTDRLAGFPDQNYLVSTLRQAMISNGVRLSPDRKSAKYIVEARAGVLGTNSSTVLLGVPATTLPSLGGVAPGAPSAIPEIPFAKTTRQWGMAKIALFAYNAETGTPVWQSGSTPVMSDAKNTWFFGAGPYQRGSIYGDRRSAVNSGLLPFRRDEAANEARAAVPVTAEAIFDEPPQQMATRPETRTEWPAANAPLTLAPAEGPKARYYAPPMQPQAGQPPATPQPHPNPTQPANSSSVPLDQSSASPAEGFLNVIGSGEKLFVTKPEERQ